MSAYYNEIDEYAAQWLRNLIAAGHIAPGDVDTRSIEDVAPDDIRHYTQCHFFAGIGVWSHALRRAGWADDRPVWTGSCPCQPFSVAGKGNGFDDERHLWPAFFHLVEECRPIAVFGEQVASKDGYAWLDLVQADLEGRGYTCGALVAPAAGFGAPHQRHRLYWVADSRSAGLPEFRGQRDEPEGVAKNCLAGGVGNPAGIGLTGRGQPNGSEQPHERGTAPIGGGIREQAAERGSSSFWSAADWLYCRDEKYRPVEPGTFPLAHGATARVGRLRAYGNAICAPQAEEFIKAYLEVRP